MGGLQIGSTASTSRITTSNRAEVHRTSTNPIMRALKGLSNTFQKWVGSSGQKGYSSPPASKQSINKMEIIGVQTQNAPNKAEIKRPNEAPPAPPIRVPNSTPSSSGVASKPPRPEPPAPLMSRNSSSAISASSKTQVTRPTSSPPPPPPLVPVRMAPPIPVAAKASQQGQATSVQKESGPDRPIPSVNETKEMLQRIGETNPKALIDLMFALNQRKNNQ